MLTFISGALSKIGPRPSCSPSERALGGHLETTWADFCDDVRAEEFKCAPHAFLGVIPVAAMLSIGAFLLIGESPWLSLGISIAVSVTIAYELLFYRELIDPLFPAKTGANIVGTITPTGDVRRRIILTAHQDSAWEFNLWYWFKSLGVVVNILGLLGMMVPAILSGLVLGDVLSSESDLLFWLTTGWLPFVVAHLFFHTGRAVPGAMDDLAGIAVITETGRSIAQDRLEHTEVLLVACAAEECGLRGAKRFVSQHSWVLHQLPTYDLNVDGVYDEQYFTAITRELTTNTVHDPALLKLADDIATSRGARLQHAIIPFGGTDAAAFAAVGVKTLSLLCQDTSRLAPNYHTRLDTIEHIRPEALETMHDQLMGMATAIDSGALD